MQTLRESKRPIRVKKRINTIAVYLIKMIVFFLSLAFATERWSGTMASVPGMRLVTTVDDFNVFEAINGKVRSSMNASLNLDVPRKRYRRYYPKLEIVSP